MMPRTNLDILSVRNKIISRINIRYIGSMCPEVYTICHRFTEIDIFSLSSFFLFWFISLSWRLPYQLLIMMTSSNGNIFFVTGPLWGESTGDRWIPFTEASDTELWCFLWSAPEQLVEHRWRRWFETPSNSLWRHCNFFVLYILKVNRIGKKNVLISFLSR